MRDIGSKGGKKTKQLHPDHHKEAGRKGALARWGSKPKDTAKIVGKPNQRPS